MKLNEGKTNGDLAELMERTHIHPNEMLGGYDGLQLARSMNVAHRLGKIVFKPNSAYRAYHDMHKVYVGQKSAPKLIDLAENLKKEPLPEAKDSAAWAYAEASLVSADTDTDMRLSWVDEACEIWQETMGIQDAINHSSDRLWMHEDSTTYRYATSIAFRPLIESFIRGNVTEEALERTFNDVLALGQHAGLQRHLAQEAGSIVVAKDLIGYEHEINAMLAILHMNDPRYICLPSSARAGSGLTHAEQTHDIVVINQHWGKLLDAAPVEIKAKPTTRDIRRYKALIVRGKMHLGSPGKYDPKYAREAFAATYEQTHTQEQAQMVSDVEATVKELLQLYRSGQKDGASSSLTRYRDKSTLFKVRPEVSLNRSRS